MKPLLDLLSRLSSLYVVSLSRSALSSYTYTHHPSITLIMLPFLSYIYLYPFPSHLSRFLPSRLRYAFMLCFLFIQYY
ncbi:hypothetical protein BJ165DRAFT_1494265 [Panaeolus papilionaceus]|nr:hypothetical protein BJ165DRAFT_1494265 [Panaeolus papilionaceus]